MRTPSFVALLLGSSLAGIAAPALAQVQADTATATQSAAPDRDDDIVVLGTRRSDRTIADSASPVDVISAAELSTQPTANMLDTVKNLVPSFYVGQNTISDASTFVRAPSLRGLPGDQLLVMLNGKRYNRSALVQVAGGGDTGLSYGSQAADISAIPSIAIGSLQVLREGATAQYGSDAIAGVLNYGLRKDAGFELQTRVGQYYKNDGDSRQIAANVGAKLGSAGFVNLSGEYNDDLGTSRGVTRPTAATFATLNPTLAEQIPNYPGPAQIYGTSPSHGYKLLLNAGVDVSENSELYLFVNVARTKANQSFNYRSPISVSGLQANDGSGSTVSLNAGRNGSFNPVYLTRCPAGNATCPSTGFVLDGNTFSAANLYPAGFTPRFVGVTKEAYGTLGYKGNFESGLTFDFSASLARNVLSLSMYDSISPSFGPNTQTSFEFGDLIQKEVNANADFTYPVEVGFASPITLSAGAEYRKETYETTAGDDQSYGAGPYAVQSLYRQVSPGVYQAAGGASQSPAASGYGGTSPDVAGSSSQRSWGIYAGAEADITPQLTVGIAGRHEKYNTFGNADVGKINALWKVAPWLSARGTVGTGFHAPSPGQSNTAILTTSFRAGNQVQTGTFSVDNPVAVYYGSKPLTPEKSTNWGAGLVVTPVERATLTIDYYNIKVKNRIFITQNFSVTDADIAANPVLAAVGPGGEINYFTNGLDTLTRGVDVVGSYRIPFDSSSLNLTVAYNYNNSKVTRSEANVISDAQIDQIAHLAPNHRVNLGASWSSGDFTLNTRGNYYSWWRAESDYPGQKFDPRFTADLDVSYTLMEHYTLTVGANNIFNTYPEKIAPSASNPIYALTGGTLDGSVYPRSGGPFGMNGGFYYARLRIKY